MIDASASSSPSSSNNGNNNSLSSSPTNGNRNAQMYPMNQQLYFHYNNNNNNNNGFHANDNGVIGTVNGNTNSSSIEVCNQQHHLNSALHSKSKQELMLCQLSNTLLRNNRECFQCHALFNADDLLNYLNNVRNNCPKCNAPVDLNHLDQHFFHDAIVQKIVSIFSQFCVCVYIYIYRVCWFGV
jgi:hypothetical protein